MSDESAFEGWCILELLGHRRLGGYVREHELAGHGFLRIDVPEGERTAAFSQFVAPGSVYAITPTTEEIARAVARRGTPEPVQRWELLPEPKRATVETRASYPPVPDPDDYPYADDYDPDEDEDNEAAYEQEGGPVEDRTHAPLPFE